MILPSKHISENQALLGVGAVLLNELKRPQTVTSLWEKVRTHPTVGGFDRYVLTLDMLYIIGTIRTNRGMLERVGT